MGALEGFDNMVNDALYGILYRDINPVRGLIDQRVSRMINGYFGVVINTGEDNYLRTADAVEAAPSVTASQFINYQLARDSGVPDEQIALGDAFEIDVPVTNGLLLRVGAGAADARAVPRLPGQVHAADAAHGRQPVPHARVPTRCSTSSRSRPARASRRSACRPRAIFTPHIHDRVLGLENVDYVFNAARDLGEEIEFKPRRDHPDARAGGARAARTSCWSGSPRSACSRRSSEATFGDVSRRIDEGRGIEGIVDDRGGLLQPRASS